MLFTTTAVLVGLVYGFLPFMVLPLYAAIERIDWSLVEAGRDLYASGWNAFRRITWPLSRPGVIAGSVLVFIPSLGAYVTPEILGGARTTLLGQLRRLPVPRGAELAVWFGAVGGHPRRDARGDHGLLPHRGPHVVREGTRPSGVVQRLLGLQAWLVFLFLYAPIIVLIVYSFNDNRNVGVWTRPSLRWYEAMLQDDNVLRSLRNSLVVALVSTIVSTILGTAAGLALERYRFRGQRAYDGLLYLPIIIPDVTMAVMLLLFFTQAFAIVNGAIGTRLNLGLTSISLAHIAFNISFVAVVVRARLGQMDAHLEEAASDLYANRWSTFRRVTLPLIMPGVAGGALLALTISLDDVVVTSFVTGPGSTTLPVYVFGLVRRGVSPLINAVSTVMLVASMILVGVSLGFQRRTRPAAVVGQE